jgi:hypothetical protein
MANKKIKNTNKKVFNGIHFKSQLEVMVYKTLLQEGFNVQYEAQPYILWKGFKPTLPFFDQNKKTRLLELKNTKIIDIKYTPDFSFIYKDKLIFIEAKGKENDVFYIKKKLFRAYLEDKYFNKELKQFPMYFEIYTKKQLLQAIEIIKSYDISK